MLEVKNLCKTFSGGPFSTRRVPAVNNVSLCLEEGKTLGLVGNSGCGKSSVVRLIAGLIAPTSGHVVFEGEDIACFGSTQMKRYHRSVQMIFQNPESSLDPIRKVRGSLMEALAIHRLCTSREDGLKKILDIMERVGVSPALLDRYPHQISGGEAQRLVICRALLLDPQVLLLDEPTSMLDVSVQAHIMNLLKQLQAQLGLTYLFISHDIELVGWLSDTIGVMNEGRLIEYGKAADVIKNPQQDYTKKLLRSYSSWD